MGLIHEIRYRFVLRNFRVSAERNARQLSEINVDDPQAHIAAYTRHMRWSDRLTVAGYRAGKTIEQIISAKLKVYDAITRRRMRQLGSR